MIFIIPWVPHSRPIEIVMGWTPFYRTSNELEHHFSNIEWTRTCSSIGDRTGTPYFWLRTIEHRTSNLMMGLWLNLLNYSLNWLSSKLHKIHKLFWWHFGIEREGNHHNVYGQMAFIHMIPNGNFIHVQIHKSTYYLLHTIYQTILIVDIDSTTLTIVGLGLNRKCFQV